MLGLSNFAFLAIIPTSHAKWRENTEWEKKQASVESLGVAATPAEKDAPSQSLGA